jgi:hypothetical protein
MMPSSPIQHRIETRNSGRRLLSSVILRSFHLLVRPHLRTISSSRPEL